MDGIAVGGCVSWCVSRGRGCVFDGVYGGFCCGLFRGVVGHVYRIGCGCEVLDGSAFSPRLCVCVGCAVWCVVWWSSTCAMGIARSIWAVRLGVCPVVFYAPRCVLWCMFCGRTVFFEERVANLFYGLCLNRFRYARVS